MKRVKLIKTLEEMGCILSGMGATMIGIKTRKQVSISRYHGIMKSMRCWQNILLKSSETTDLEVVKT
jgi:hypothetical protein